MKVCSICQRCYSDAEDVCREDGSDELVRRGAGDPEMIPGYTLERRVGVTRNAETFDAYENTSGTSCVVRLFSAAADILREANAVKSIFNAGLIGVYDTGAIDDGRVFVVSEDAKGQSLRELLANVGPPDLLTSIAIVRQAAEALHSLHTNGITHGAINPENIYLTSGADGRALVRIGNVDYARVVEHAITSNKFGIDDHVDELRYFSPEQCTADERTPLSDVYSLGVVFFELLVGAPPFDGTKAVELIDKHLHARPPEVKIDNFELRMLVTHALSESLQKHPGSRQSSASLFARQLRHIEQLATHTSTPPPAVKDIRHVEPTSPRVEIYPTVPATRAVTPPVVHVGATRKAPELADPKRELDTAPVVDTEPATAVPKRSRLRLLKRKLNALSAMVTSTLDRGTLAGITGPDVSPKKTARKIEWVQPEDDVPSVEEVVEALAVDGKSEVEIVDAPTQSKEKPSSMITLDLASESVDAAQTSIAKPVEATKIEPVIATPVEATVAIGVTPEIQTPVVQAKKPGVVTAPAKTAPTPKPKVVERVEKAPPKPSVVIAPQRQPVVVTRPQFADADEEITLVRPPRRMRIDVEKPRTIYRAQTAYARSADDISFQPTMIGARKENRSRAVIAAESHDGMFFAHFGAGSVRSDLKYRVMIVGAGCIVLATLFLFANDSVSGLFQSVSPGDSTTAQATTSEAPLPSVNPVIKPTKASLRKSTETPAVESKRDRTAIESKPKAKSDEIKPSVEKTKPTVKPKVTKTADAPRKKADPPAQKTVTRPGGATRPRIVSDPRP